MPPAPRHASRAPATSRAAPATRVQAADARDDRKRSRSLRRALLATRGCHAHLGSPRPRAIADIEYHAVRTAEFDFEMRPRWNLVLADDAGSAERLELGSPCVHVVHDHAEMMDAEKSFGHGQIIRRHLQDGEVDGAVGEKHARRARCMLRAGRIQAESIQLLELERLLEEFGGLAGMVARDRDVPDLRHTVLPCRGMRVPCCARITARNSPPPAAPTDAHRTRTPSCG